MRDIIIKSSNIKLIHQIIITDTQPIVISRFSCLKTNLSFAIKLIEDASAALKTRAPYKRNNRSGMMHPYWITFVDVAAYSQFGLGFGVTANSEDDARQILAAAVPDAPAIASVTPIKGMRDLDQGHVVPNMSNWFRRGIWFPRGYESLN